MYWSHAAIIIVIDNIPYLYETIDISSYNYKKIKCVYNGKVLDNKYFGSVLHKLSNIPEFLGDISHISYIGPRNKKR